MNELLYILTGSDAPIPFSAAELEWLARFKPKAEVRVVPPKTVLLHEGEASDRLYLIRKGALRLYFDKDGKDVTFQFFFEQECVASLDSFLSGRPSAFSLESIEPSELCVVEREDFFRLLGQLPTLKRVYEEKLADRLFVYQHLFLSHIKYTPRQRYEILLRERPDIMRRVPQHYIASYLGVTPVSLSRIRSRHS